MMAVSARGGSDSSGQGLWPGTPATRQPAPADPVDTSAVDQAWQHSDAPAVPASETLGPVTLPPALDAPAPRGRGRHRRGHRAVEPAVLPTPGNVEAPPDWEPASRGGGCWRVFREFVIVIAVALVLSALVRAFLVQAFFVPSESMEATLVPSDRILVSKITKTLFGVQRGEVVVFRDPGGWLDQPPAGAQGLEAKVREFVTFMGLLPSDTGRDLVKRVIAVGGDSIACCDATGRIVLNGVSLDEPYVQGPTNQVLFNVTVPPGGLFVMGDNRGNSRDSRYHIEDNAGAVPLGDVVGRSVLVLWPFDNVRTIPVPTVFLNPAVQRPPSR